jgi:hypothetical protein
VKSKRTDLKVGHYTKGEEWPSLSKTKTEREGQAKQTPILMSSVLAQGQGNVPPHVTLYVIVEVEQP